jgi:hypothetical protein
MRDERGEKRESREENLDHAFGLISARETRIER